MTQSRPTLPPPSPFFILVGSFLVLLFLAGGSARADVLGQVVVRSGAWAVVIAMALLQDRAALGRLRSVSWLMLATLLLVMIQLVPLPPVIWQALPGRSILAGATEGVATPWRPIAMVPGATFNAASSLVVPLAALLAIAGVRAHERYWIFVLLFGLIVASMLVGLIQLSGVDLRNPLLNGDERQVRGLFANRNHFALFMAMGCVMAPVWGFATERSSGWRLPVVAGLQALFLLMILASGSRAGLALGGIGLMLGGALVWPRARYMFRRYPRWVLPLGGALLISVFVVASVVAGRAVSIDRLFHMNQATDMRTQALPTVLSMIRTYFPIGSGFGGFDPIFRIHEPFTLLKTTYFNHAHNDFLEIVLDGGLPAGLLLVAGLGWWGHASVRALRMPGMPRSSVPPLLGSGLLLLLFVASLFDYPARTPIMMGVIVIAATWLADTDKRSTGSTLPGASEQL